VKIFDKEQNKHNYFSQNHGQIPNVNVQVSITNENNQEVFSFEGITNDDGLIETKYLIPDNSGIETLTITINAENENSVSSKILQVFVLGNLSNNG
jgi:phosphatidate phosphatase APP1